MGYKMVFSDMDGTLLWKGVRVSVENSAAIRKASDSVNGSLSGCGFPKLIVRLPCGSPSIRSTFFPACARPIPKFAQVVVLPTPPFWLAMAMICVFMTSPHF